MRLWFVDLWLGLPALRRLVHLALPLCFALCAGRLRADSELQMRCDRFLSQLGGRQALHALFQGAQRSYKRATQFRDRALLVAHLESMQRIFNEWHFPQQLRLEFAARGLPRLILAMDAKMSAQAAPTHIGNRLLELGARYPGVKFYYAPLRNHNERAEGALITLKAKPTHVELYLALDDLLSVDQMPVTLSHESIHLANHFRLHTPEYFASRLLHTDHATFQANPNDGHKFYSVYMDAGSDMMARDEVEAYDISISLLRQNLGRVVEDPTTSPEQLKQSLSMLLEEVLTSAELGADMIDGFSFIANSFKKSRSSTRISFEKRYNKDFLVIHYLNDEAGRADLNIPVNLAFDPVLGAEIQSLGKGKKISELSIALREQIQQNMLEQGAKIQPSFDRSLVYRRYLVPNGIAIQSRDDILDFIARTAVWKKRL